MCILLYNMLFLQIQLNNKNSSILCICCILCMKVQVYTIFCLFNLLNSVTTFNKCNTYSSHKTWMKEQAVQDCTNQGQQVQFGVRRQVRCCVKGYTVFLNLYVYSYWSFPPYLSCCVFFIYHMINTLYLVSARIDDGLSCLKS
jgi:hypothetical protein